jgi:hypothetical protein
LAPKLAPSHLAITQPLPSETLRIGHAFPQLSGVFSAHTPPRPSPARGEGVRRYFNGQKCKYNNAPPNSTTGTNAEITTSRIVAQLTPDSDGGCSRSQRPVNST